MGFTPDNDSESSPSPSIPAVYASNVFNDVAMRERLPKNAYRALRATVDEGRELDPSVAEIVANAMKDWAIEKGATHYCHWFQPMTGVTAEKHDSFISPTPDGRILMEFSGKELIQGEPDASSFPSGGLRATFEARGYTAWDCTSPVFVKEDGDNVSLFIPSAFCSYTGEALDKKTPLLRSMEALNRQALRVLHVLGNTSARRVHATLGGEQEYFLVDKRLFDMRLDLQLAGRTVFGAPSPKGQEMEDHYFGSLDERVASFMSETNRELWKLGVSAKTQHNEVAPGQYEVAPVFATVNVATDNNQVTMATLQKVARHHGLVCLLHEKPFAGVNGSGKHSNWSMVTDDGVNLLDPGDTPHDNMQFLVFLFAVIRAVDRHAELLRASVATPGNDHRLGANEAPPAIVSIFLGAQLTDIYGQLENGGAGSSQRPDELRLGVSTLPPLPKDCTDRNRTSPFAFTGNKFEFRMVGSSQSLSGPNFVLNTIVADALAEIADALEAAENDSDLNAQAQLLLQRYAKEHKRIIFNGDNYTDEWRQEAHRRGLPNWPNSVDSLRTILTATNVTLLSRHAVLSEPELEARVDILLEAYSKTVNIEAQTMVQMAHRSVVPAGVKYGRDLCRTVSAAEEAGIQHSRVRELAQRVLGLTERLMEDLENLEKTVEQCHATDGADEKASAFRDHVTPLMVQVRESVDKLEQVVDSSVWPLPTYADMLFSR